MNMTLIWIYINYSLGFPEGRFGQIYISTHHTTSTKIPRKNSGSLSPMIPWVVSRVQSHGHRLEASSEAFPKATSSSFPAISVARWAIFWGDTGWYLEDHPSERSCGSHLFKWDIILGEYSYSQLKGIIVVMGICGNGLWIVTIGWGRSYTNHATSHLTWGSYQGEAYHHWDDPLRVSGIDGGFSRKRSRQFTGG